MHTPREDAQPNVAKDLLINLQSRQVKVIGDARELIQSGAIEDPADRGIVDAGVAFIENPTEDIEEIKKQAADVGMVMGGYEMQGLDVPPAIDAMHAHLLALQCVNRVSFVEQELDRGELTDSPAIKDAMVWALSAANNLADGYKDQTLLITVKALQLRLDSL